MKTRALKLFARQIKPKWIKFSTSAIVNKQDYIIKSTLEDIVIPSNIKFHERLWKESASFKNHVALECAETKKNYTYEQLFKNISTFATSLHKKFGLKQRDMVSVMLPNCPEFAVAAFGVLRAGCVLTTYNPIYKEFEISHQVTTTEPKVIVTIPECYDNVVNGLKLANSNPKIVLVDNLNTAVPEGAVKFSEVAENGETDYSLLDKIETKMDDTAVVPFSSGTTGLPKGVDITYKNLFAALEIMGHEKVCFPHLTHGDVQDVVPCILPFFHIYGMVVTLLGHLTKGCKLVTLPKFSATLFIDVLKTQNSSLLYLVPPVAILLGKHPDITKEHLRNVRLVLCGAAPLSGSDVVPVLEKGNGKLQFCQGFGTTETSSLGTSTFIGTEVQDYSSSGFPLSNMELKFVDPQTGKAVPIGEAGELWIRGPTVMNGYHKNDKATKENLTDDGFYKTGDLGHFKPEYGMYITDRIKELIKVKGLQVAPAELEGILRSHPAVQDAAVIGIPHQFYGEVPKAVIIPKKGLKPDAEDIQTFVAEKVASFKKIEEVVFVEDIPKTTSGKILRKELKKMYA